MLLSGISMTITEQQPHNKPTIVLDQALPAGQLDFSAVFGRCGPVEIEIGSGKGTFLLHQGAAFGQTNFIGLEYARKYCMHAVGRMERHGISNVRLVRAEAVRFLTENIKPGTVAGFHIYFPDPWPKRKHHKRRFIGPANMELLLTRLQMGGFIKIATDHKGYFRQIERMLAQFSDQLESVEFEPAAGANPGEYVGTNFERKYLKEGRAVYTAAVVKRANLVQQVNSGTE